MDKNQSIFIKYIQLAKITLKPSFSNMMMQTFKKKQLGDSGFKQTVLVFPSYLSYTCKINMSLC